MKVLEGPAPEPSQRAHASLDSEWRDEGELDLLAPALFAWRNRYLVMAVTIAAAVAGFVAAQLQPARYTASAVVFVNTPRSQNPLAPEPLSIESIERLANSNVTESRVDADLRKKNLLPSGHRVIEFESTLYKSTDPARPYLPMLGLTVHATTPELARDATNLWATAITDEAARLDAATRQSAVEFIVREYPEASKRLHESERALAATKDEFGRTLTSAKARAAISLRDVELWSREQQIVELERQRHRLIIDLKEAEASVVALEQEVTQVPQLIVVAKAISDDALWDTAARNSGKPMDLSDSKLRSQEVNPVYTALVRRVAEARVKRSELASRRTALDVQIAAARREEAGSRSARLEGERAIETLERQQETELAAKEREIEGVRASYDKLAESIGDAQIVKAQRESTVSVGSPAEVPGGPSGPDVKRYAGAGALIGLVFGLLAGAVMDRIRKDRLAAA
jgi:uncharacterized protein involved in exopolysaccharide biosynthesis